MTGSDQPAIRADRGKKPRVAAATASVADPSELPPQSPASAETTKVVRAIDFDAFDEKVATLLVISGSCMGELHNLEQDETLLGRGPECDVVIRDDGISRQHCLFRRLGDEVVIEDLGSTNGTWVNRERASSRVLKPGDRVRLGVNTLVRYVVQSEADRAYHRDLYRAAVRDPLTGAFNKRYLRDRLRTELAYSARHKTSLTLVVFDLDGFKQVNDTLGHTAGDSVIAQLGSVLLEQTREEDIVARFGGDEFVILLRGIEPAAAERFAERIRRVVADTRFVAANRHVQLTLSIGTATAVGQAQHAEELFDAADAALYEAKRAGKNRVVSVRL